MIALKVPCDNLAARFMAVSTPAGALPMRQSTGQSPRQVAALPASYVEVTDGSVTPNSQWEHHVHVDSVHLFAKRPGDPARVEVQRQLWLPTLLAATEGQMKLNVGAKVGYELKSALPMTWRWAEETVGGDQYDAIRISWDLWFYETVSLVP